MCEDRITPALENVLACVEARFADCDAPSFCRSSIVGGTVAWDDCCDCGTASGQLWVRLVEWGPDPEIEPTGFRGCDHPGVITVGVGALRCVPTVDEEGHAPSASEEREAAMRVHADAQLILDGVMCCTPDRRWMGWLPLGYEGGCGGGEHLFSVPFSTCQCE